MRAGVLQAVPAAARADQAVPAVPAAQAAPVEEVAARVTVQVAALRVTSPLSTQSIKAIRMCSKYPATLQILKIIGQIKR